MMAAPAEKRVADAVVSIADRHIHQLTATIQRLTEELALGRLEQAKMHCYWREHPHNFDRRFERIEERLARVLKLLDSDPQIEATIARLNASSETATAHGKIADAETIKLSNQKTGIDSRAEGAD